MSSFVTDRISARFNPISLSALTIFIFASGSPTPARGQCGPQQLSKLVASDAADSDVFGVSVAFSGDTALVGAYFDDNAGGVNAGAAYVFVNSGGVWTQQAKLVATDGFSGDFFGYSVALDGDTALIGSRGDGAGSAYVFKRFGSVWIQEAKLTAVNAELGDKVGFSVALSGDTAVVGARGNSDGAAYVFVHSKKAWIQQAKLIASEAEANDFFGDSVAISGDTVVVGSRLHDDDGNLDVGSAFVFVRTGAVWTQQAKLTAADAETNDYFGFSVAISADTVLVGAYGAAGVGGPQAGAAYVFARSGSVWFQEAKLIGAGTVSGDWLGWSVGIKGDIAVIGAHLDDNAGGIDAGSAYIFTRSGGNWSGQPRLSASDAAADDGFGYSIAVGDDMALIGAVFDDHAGGTNAGSAYVFYLGCDFDEDGVLNSNDACPNNTPGLPIASNGRPLRDCNNDCLFDGADIDCIVNEMLSQP